MRDVRNYIRTEFAILIVLLIEIFFQRTSKIEYLQIALLISLHHLENVAIALLNIDKGGFIVKTI